MTDLVKTDFYDHVNGEWVKTAEIPVDKPATGGFQDLVQDIEQLLMAEFAEMATGTKEIPAGRMKDAIEFYKLANDYETRNKLGVEPVKPLLAKVAALNSLEELNQQFPEWVLEGMPLPFALDVDQDMKDTQTNVVYAYPASTFLPDKTYYEENHPQGPELLKVFSEMTVSILEKFGKTNEEAAAIVADALAFDRSIVPHVRSSEENADYSKNYNPKSIAEFAAYSKELDLKKLVNDLVHDTPGEIIVTEPEYFAAFQQIVNPETFALLKNWLLVQVSLSYTSILSEDLRQLGSTYSRYLSGIDEAAPQQKAAYYLATNRFSQVVGDYYGKKYFGEKAKQDVEHMVEAMIAIYQNRLKNNTWLSENTREKAVVKLGTLGIQVGYPERIPELYDAFITKPAEDGGTLVENARFFSRLVREDNFSRFHKPVDRKEWEMSAATVNAYYHPFKNIIVFPAAILQAPFYSLEQSSSANYGGIGAVIAHEISHAFDNNGAKFDEFGNLNNWWTKEDLTHFEDLSKAMIAEFDGISFAGGKVNGTLTVSENIADAGGLSCALEAAKKEADVSLEDFFTNWAKIWRTKAREQYQQLLLSIDVHAPAKLRANVQVKNLDDFYTTFNITEEDAMYLSPEKRVHIW
ncbi:MULTISPECIES: M13 family metallopeptidase [Enterococcus]|uniref:M13 family metallopeptidase n=1 Tax=Enterococcus TaxID=1350 RepID=UPI0010F511EC|nr:MULTISPECIES: M13-type metalloendopeptidase [Enterococcus]KAF1300598.1 peptidase M13 [Enterococcus sp. JM9B]